MSMGELGWRGPDDQLLALPALAIYGFLVDPATGDGGFPCLWLLCLGVPCPGCGLSRANAFLWRGQLADAVNMNRLIVPVTLVLACSFVLEVVNRFRMRNNPMAELGPAELASMTKDFDDSKKMIFQSQFSSEKKDRGTATILALFNYDRIWLGDIAIGIVKLMTLGLCGIWWLIDLFTAGARCDDYNRRKAEDIVAALTLK
jgi:hypothetical protein